MNVFCSWCNAPIKWAGIEYPVSHSICWRCCREHFPAAAVALVIGAMGIPEGSTPRQETERTIARLVNPSGDPLLPLAQGWVER